MTTRGGLKRILICDDQDDILEMLSHSLCSVGYTVSLAPGFREFMERFCEQTPDLILLDIYMPEHDGFWIVDHLPCNHCIPIIFMTAHDRPVYRLCAPMVGAASYIVKPFEPHELLVRIETALRPTPRLGSTQFLAAISETYSPNASRHQQPTTIHTTE